MVARLVEGVTPEREGAGRVADSLDVETCDLLLETARSKQDVVGRDPAIFEIELAPFLTAHEARRLADSEPRCVARHDHGADATDPGSEPRVDEEDRGVRAEGGKHLGAVDDVVGMVRALFRRL